MLFSAFCFPLDPSAPLRLSAKAGPRPALKRHYAGIEQLRLILPSSGFYIFYAQPYFVVEIVRYGPCMTVRSYEGIKPHRPLISDISFYLCRKQAFVYLHLCHGLDRISKLCTI